MRAFSYLHAVCRECNIQPLHSKYTPQSVSFCIPLFMVLYLFNYKPKSIRQIFPQTNQNKSLLSLLSVDFYWSDPIIMHYKNQNATGHLEATDESGGRH